MKPKVPLVGRLLKAELGGGYQTSEKETLSDTRKVRTEVRRHCLRSWQRERPCALGGGKVARSVMCRGTSPKLGGQQRMKGLHDKNGMGPKKQRKELT